MIKYSSLSCAIISVGLCASLSLLLNVEIALSKPLGHSAKSENPHIIRIQADHRVRACIRRACRTVYSDCVRRQNPRRQPADWIRRHCSGQLAFCQNQCRREFSGPPGGPPLRPPPSLRPPSPPRYGNCYWDGSRPFCAGRCRPGYVRMRREGSGCVSGARVYCCEPMGSVRQR